MHAPWVFEMDEGGRATVRQPIQSWSPLDGGYVRNCPDLRHQRPPRPSQSALNPAAASSRSRTTRDQANSRSARARPA